MTTPPSATFGAERAPPWLEALPESAVLLNESGTILAVNALWRAFGLANGGASHAYLGENYLGVCQRVLCDEIGDLSQQMEDVLKGYSSSLEWEYPCHSPSECRWFRLTATRFQDQGQIYVLVIHHDISHRRLTDETAKAHAQQLESVLAHTREGLIVIQGQGPIRARGKARAISRCMPVVVAAGAEAWLDPTITDRETLKRYLRPLAPGALNARQVDSATDRSTQKYGGQNLPILPPFS